MIDYSDRKGNWMQTFTGRSFYPIDPREEDIDIVDIAHSLSMQCRYAGHSKKFYSIAEHSCHIHDAAPPELRFQALMHDASEAYLVDIPRPVKPYLENYASIEEGLMLTIAKKFDFTWPMSPIVKSLDTGILLDEKEAIMNPGHQSWNMVGDGIGAKIQCWDHDKAFNEFLSRFYRYVEHNHVS